MSGITESLIVRYKEATELNASELEQLISELQGVDAPQHMIDRTEGLLFRQISNHASAAQKFLNAFMASQDLLILDEFFWSFSKITHLTPEPAYWSVINLFLDIIDQLYKTNSNQITKAKCNTYFGFLMYHLPGSLETKKTVGEKWLGIIGCKNIQHEMIDFVSSDDTDMSISTIRFFAYALACAGLENEVIYMNTIIADRSRQDVFSFDAIKSSAETYATEKIFQNTTDLFCNLLLNSENYENVLDIGCGPGRIGVNIRSRCKTLTGIELDPEYATFAKNVSNYDNVIEGDAVEEIDKLSCSFDLITSCMALDYIPARTIIRDAAKILTPGGYLAFSFIPAKYDAGDVLAHMFHYQPEFYKKEAPDLTVVKCVMEPYMWTGGYFVLLRRSF